MALQNAAEYEIPYMVIVEAPPGTVRPLLGRLVYNACFCDKRVLSSSFIRYCI